MKNLGVVIVAAGRGSRMRTSESKQFLPLAGMPILIHTLLRFHNLPEVGMIVVVVPAGDEERVRRMAESYGCADKLVKIVAGGKERQHSVLKGLSILKEKTDLVLVHDGVRPFVSPHAVRAVSREAERTGAAVLAVRVKDTIKTVGADGVIQNTPDRQSLWAVQTPQAFRLSLLLEAYEAAAASDVSATDDAMLVERLGVPVHIVEGEYSNIKITTPEDLEWAEHLLARNNAAARSESSDKRNESVEIGIGGGAMIRVGQGFDVHAFAEGRKCIIGGVDIPFELGLAGHSDADVLLHAVSDAVLGAIGLGDIGRHFPDTDPNYKDADSVELLNQVWKMAQERDYVLGNLDATIIAQAPKMAPYIPRMREVIALSLQTDPTKINIKASTTEKLGFPGRGEGIAAQAIVCLLKQDVLS